MLLALVSRPGWKLQCWQENVLQAHLKTFNLIYNVQENSIVCTVMLCIAHAKRKDKESAPTQNKGSSWWETHQDAKMHVALAGM